MIRYLLATLLFSAPCAAHDRSLSIQVHDLLDGHLGIGVGGKGGLDVGVDVGVHVSPPLTGNSRPSPVDHPPPDEDRLRKQVNSLSDIDYARLRRLCVEVEALINTPDHPLDADLLWLCKFVQSIKR